MDRGIAIPVAVAIGGTLAAQAPLNALLGRHVGNIGATLVAFAVGLAALVAVSAVAGGFDRLGALGDAPSWAIVGGGLISALYVTSIVWTVKALGAGGLTAATIGGQFAVALAIDHFGWLGIERQPITLSKLAGLALLAAGTYLVVSD
jgi:transporter family-2 protein